MQKIVIDKDTDMVTQIINLDVDSRFDADWYRNCYVVDDVDNNINTYNLKYNKETETFEVVEGVEPIPTSVTAPSEVAVLKERVEELETVVATHQKLTQENELLKMKLKAIEEKLGI